MKRANLVRLFSILAIVAVVVTMAPPALSSDAYVNRGGVAAPLPEPARAADAVRLTAGDSLHATMLGAREDWQSSEGLPVLASAALTPTLPVADDAPALDVPLADDLIWAGDSFTGTRTAAPEGALAAPESMFGFKPALSLELLLDVQPSRAKPGDVLSYRLVASHTGYEPLTDITIDIPTPRGLVYVAGSAVGFSYEPSAKLLTWPVAALQPGEALTGSFQLRATGLAMGELATVQASAASPLADGTALGSAVAEITPPAADRVRVTPAEGGWLRSLDGWVEVKAPAGAVAAPLLFSYRPAEGALPPGPRFAFQLNAEVEGGAPVERFQQPVTLVYPYRQAGVPTEEARGMAFFHLDEATGVWRTVATAIDPARGVLLAQSEHFGAFAVGATADLGSPVQRIGEGATAEAVSSQSYEFDPGSRIRGAQPQLFSGSIGFTYGFDLPPGRGGLTPSLGLQYSSARHQRETGHYNHVGHGWDMLGESTLMKADPSNPAGSKLTMVLNGSSYTIDTSRWFSKEDPFIQMWEYLTPTAGFPYYQLRVRTQDGMLYIFKGYANITDDDNPWPPAGEPPMVFKWKTGQNNECGGFANLDWVKLPLVQVQDPSGNVIQHVWTAASTLEQGRHGQSDVRTDDYGCHYIRTLRLSEMRYNFEGATAQTRIKLRYDNGQPQANLRYDRSDTFDQWGGMHLFAIYKLLGVDVVALNGSGLEQVVRQYNVNYHDQCAGGCDANKGNTLLLPSQIVETAGGVSETTSFVYRDRNGVQNKTLGTACDYGYLSQMDNPYGGRSSFAAELFTAQCGSSRPPRVQMYTMTDLVSNTNWTWEYAAFTWEVDTHGYAQVNVLWPPLGDGVRRLEQHFFKQKEYLPGTTTQIDHLAGREWKTVACLPASASPSAICASGGELTKSETDWAHTVNDMPVNGSDLPAEQRPRFVYAQQSRSYRETLPMVRTDYGYEKDRQNGSQLGNLTYQQERLGSGSAWAAAALRTTYTQYYPNLTYWVVNKPAWSHFYEKCYDVPGQADPCDGGVIKSAVRNYYDNATSPDVIVPNKGRLMRQEQGEGSVWQDTRYSYAPNGNLLKVERMDGGVVVNSTETFYDPRFRAYPVCTKNILGHTTQQRYYGVPGSTDAGCTTTAGSNLPATGGFFGQLEQAIDENGQGTTLQYDGLGRILKVARPGDSVPTSASPNAPDNPTVRFSYTAFSGQGAPFWIKKEQRENLSSAGAGEYLETRIFYDGFGRVIQTQAEAASASQSIVASTQYNAAGQVLQQNAPYFHAAALGGYLTPNWAQPKTVTSYDAYGRVKQVTNPDSSKTCTYYQGLQTAVVYEQTAGATYKYFQKISATDQLGRLSSVKDYMGTVGNNPGAACPAPAWAANPNGTTSYQYDVADRLTTTTAPDNAQIQITYDALGRKTQMIDPDMGTWTYAYDQVSNLTRQTDARGQTVCFYYDGLSRLLGKHTRTDLDCPAWTSNPSLAAQYTYDAGSNGIGRRTGMTDGSGSASWLYDTRGRVTRETKVVSGAGGGTFVTNWTAYDAMDRVRTMQYPDGESVTFSYTAQGPLKGVSGTSVYVGDTLYNALGQVSDRYLGSTPNEIRQKFTYTQAENFRLTALQSGTSASGYTNLQNISYTYDDQGNVLTVVDAAAFGGSQTQTFTYDALNRLLTAQATGGSHGTYTQRSYVYNNAGNIDTFEGVILRYLDGAHKHAVTHVGGTTEAHRKYWYDQNGNATRRINASQVVTLTYGVENQVTSIIGSGVTATSYIYDGDGKRVKATVGSGTTQTNTVYIGNYYERDNGTTVRKYYYAGAVRVAMRTGGNTFYLLNDHLTSTAITTNASGVRQTELRYYAYGGTRYDAGGQMTLYRYTGQRIETGTGLYDYGARWYDPAIGRFLAPDSIVPNVGSSQSLNRYAYVNGNPLKYTDPSGHWLESAIDVAFIIYDIHDIATNGLTWASGGALAADVAGLILPGVTGGGALVRTVTHGDDLLRAASHADELVKAASKADEAAAVVRQAENAGELANRAEHITGATNRVSTTPAVATEGIYEFQDLLNPGQIYVGQSGNIPQRLQEHVRSGRLGGVEDARTTQVSGGKFAREIAEQDRISELGGIQRGGGGQVSNRRNPVGEARDAAARARGMKYPVRR